MAVLLPTNRLIHGFAETSRDAGLEVESPKRRGAEDGPYCLDFRGDRTKKSPQVISVPESVKDDLADLF